MKLKKILLTTLPVFLLNCGTPNQYVNISNNSNNGKVVSFTIKIDKSIFSAKKRDIEARLYNNEQLEISKQTSNCSVSYDVTTKKETFNCPPGVVYKPVNPEVFKYNLDNIAGDITIKSTTVKVGENYRIALSGLSKDDCNNASASIENKADNENISINDLSWATTELGCVPAPL